MKRSKFSLSHYNLLSFRMGELIPIACLEVLPGDSFRHATQALVRASPLLSPVMHPVHVHIRHFFVPYRLIWDEWEDFITGGPAGLGIAASPYMTTSRAGLIGSGKLSDYLGVPSTVTPAYQINALPFRAYSLIWNEYYRDQDLQTELTILKTSSADNTSNIDIQRVNWEKDYFTSARPWEQKGPTVNVPVYTTNANIDVRKSNDPNTNRNLQAANAVNGAVNITGAATAVSELRFGTVTGLQLNLDLLREGFAIRRFEENRARFGSRYVEYLRALGVRSSDARMQRPEYLGGGVQTIQFSEVLQTAEGSDPVGDLKGHGIAAMRSNRYQRFFEEHGYVISLMSVRPKSIYMNAMPRFWQKRLKEDYWQKEFEHVGQQSILNREIHGNHDNPDSVFGYQDRYDEYRRIASNVHGEFRETLLNYWHMARDLPTNVALNSSFVTSNPTERIFAASTNDTMYAMAYHSIQARRMVSKTGSHSFVF